MPRASNVREQGAFNFQGFKHISREPRQSYQGQARRSWGWPTRLLSPLAGSSREYVVVHDEEPLAFHTTLYSLKKGHASALARLELHALSQIDIWSELCDDGPKYFLAITGFEEDKSTELQWVIHIQGDQNDAQEHQRKMKTFVHRLSRLDREFRLGGSVKLYVDPDRPNEPQYKSKLEWLLGTAAPLAEPLLKNDLHCYGIVPRRAELNSPLIDACFNELLASLEAYSLPGSLRRSPSEESNTATDISPLLSRMRCSSSVQEHTVPPSTHRRGSWMSSMPFAST